MPLTVIEYTGFHPGVELGQEVVVSVNGQAAWATLAGRLFTKDGSIRESWLISDRKVEEGLAPILSLSGTDNTIGADYYPSVAGPGIESNK